MILNRVSGLIKKFDLSAIIFILGFGSYFMADAFIASHGSDEQIAEWVLLRSFIIISAVIALFGMEQLVFREPSAVPLILRALRIHMPLCAILAVSIGVWVGYVTSFVSGFIMVMCLACSNLAFHWFRSNLSITRAYVANGAWRILFFLGVVLFFITDIADISVILVCAFLLSSALILYQIRAMIGSENLIEIHKEIKTIRDVYSVGGLFFISSISLAVASFGESLVINHIGTFEDVALFLKSALVFLFPGIIFNQYLAARVGPVIRQSEAQTLRLMRKHFYKGLFGLLLILSCLILGGRVFEFVLYGQIIIPFELAIILSVTACVRILNILPSGFIGIVATQDQLLKCTIGYLGCAILLPVLSIIFYNLGFGAIISVVLANLINWTLRALVGVKLIISRLALLDQGKL